MKYFNGQLIEETADDLAITEADKIQAPITAEQEKTEKEAKATAQASGNQKLLDLGLSQAEATALTGYIPPVAE